MKVQFKVQSEPESNTVDISFRVSAIANGWIIKAGRAPFFCATSDELHDAIEDLVARFVQETTEAKQHVQAAREVAMDIRPIK